MRSKQGPLARTLLAAAAAAGAAIAASPARAEDQEGERIYAIQARKHLLGHEFTAGAGVLPMDAFFKALTFSGAYTYHFNQLLGWEVVHAAYAQNLATDLEQQLEDNFGVRPQRLKRVSGLVQSSLVVKPLYGKLAVLNRSVVPLEVFVTVGPSMVWVNGEEQPGGGAGLGFRLFPVRYVTLRLDARELVHRDVGGGVRNDLWLALSVGLNLGGG